MNKNQRIKQIYTMYSSNYDLHMRKTRHYQVQEKIIKQLNDNIMEPILDLACGTGYLIGVLAKTHKKINGNDFSKAMINAARKKHRNILFTNDSATELKSYKNKFNTIISCNLFYYISNRDKAIMRWKELLTKNGKIIFLEEYPFKITSSKEMERLSSKIISVINPIPPIKIIRIMKKRGFFLKKKISLPIDSTHNLYGLVFEKV